MNFHDLNTWSKITDTEFNISEEGLITGVNTSIKDQSATIIKNSSNTVVGIARAVAMPASVGTDFAAALATVFIAKIFELTNRKRLTVHTRWLQITSPARKFCLNT